MTPNDIEVLLHFHTKGGPHPRADAPAVENSINKFLRWGIFTKVEGTIKTTEGAKLLVDALCATPIPVQQWVMPPPPKV